MGTMKEKKAMKNKIQSFNGFKIYFDQISAYLRKAE